MRRREDLLAATLEIAAKPTMLWIEADEEKLPDGALKRFLKELGPRLFDPGPIVKNVRQAAGIGDNGWSTDFRSHFRMPPRDYIKDRRMEVATRLLREHNLEVGEVADLVGYNGMRAFSRAYRRWCGEHPSDVQGKKLPPEAEYPFYLDGILGRLELPQGRRLANIIRRVYPDPAEPEPLPDVEDGPAGERRRAADLWQRIRHLPFERQRAVVRWEAFRTTALFDLLREQSRLEGRKDPRAGVRLAQLALDSLEECDEASGERKADLYAEGRSWLGNARRLDRDLAGADAELEAALAEWRTPRANPDPRVAALIYAHQGTLRMFQRRYNEALELLEKALRLFEQEGDVKGRIHVLIQRAAVYGYMDRLEPAHADLEWASALAAYARDPFLNYHVGYNIANIQVRRDKYKDALDCLTKVKSSCELVDYPVGTVEIEHLEGNIKEGMGDYSGAQQIYSKAREKYVELRQWRGSALAGVDLTAVYARQNKHEEALRIGRELIPILESLKLHPETLATVRLVAKALADMKITHALLCSLRNQLQRDPLLQLS